MRRMHRKNKKIITSCLVIALVVSVIFAGAVFASQQTVDDSSSASLNKRVALTEEEEAYLKANPTVVVAADASWRPIEYRCDEDGNYEGVIAEVLDRLEEYTGFKFEVKIMDSYAEALAEVQAGKADMISGLANDEAVAQEYNVQLSSPYLMINSTIVSKKEAQTLYNNKENKKIAVVKGDYANDAINAKIPNSQLVECNSNEECLDLVKNDEADLAIMASYCSEYYMTVPKYSSLHSHTISDFSWEQAFGIHDDLDPLMVSILNKGIDQMENYDLNEAIYEGVINSAYDNDFMVFVYKHPVLVIGIVIVIFLIITNLLVAIFRVKKREHLRQLEDGTRLKLALERTHLCIWEIDLSNGMVTQIDNAHERHGFYELREGIPESVIAEGYVHPDDVKQVREVIRRVLAGEQGVNGCWRIKDLDAIGEDSVYWWEQVMFHIVFDDKHKPLKAIGVSEDVTSEKNSQRDSLTSVYNRSSFEEKASIVLNERRNAYLECAYLILDLDGFKGINDNYGHGMGDQVLIAVGAILNKTFRTTDIVGRLGGDEFTVFMTSISRREDAEVKAQQVVENICKLQEEENFPFAVSCSLGVVVATKGHTDLDILYKKADTALYEAKRAGKNQYKIYE